jgi:hypothetical protein
VESRPYKTQIKSVSGINFMVNERGEKTAVIIDLKSHKALWEDIYDTLLVRVRKKEPRESFDEVKRRLKRKHSRA